MLWNISKLEALFNFYRNTLNLTKKEEGGNLTIHIVISDYICVTIITQNLGQKR